MPEAPSDQRPWPLEPGFQSDTLDYPGAVSISFLAHFMRSIRWWTLEPHPELLSGYTPKFCSAVPGQEYVIYLRWGGTVDVDLRPSAESDTFRYTWIDLAEGKERDKWNGSGRRHSGVKHSRRFSKRSSLQRLAVAHLSGESRGAG